MTYEYPGPLCDGCDYTAAQCVRARAAGAVACCPDCGRDHRDAVAVFRDAVDLAALIRSHREDTP